jgi:alkylation response protein AidB-like acyl-CoA dehydrogenase
VANRVADAWIGARAYQLYTFGTVTKLAEGGELGPESSVNKLFWSHLDVELHETALDLLGPEAELRRSQHNGGSGEQPSGRWLDGWLFSLAGPIYGGTDQIQRNTVAEHLLGLPRGDR